MKAPAYNLLPHQSLTSNIAYCIFLRDETIIFTLFYSIIFRWLSSSFGMRIACHQKLLVINIFITQNEKIFKLLKIIFDFVVDLFFYIGP
jgi:hypothetical protein